MIAVHFKHFLFACLWSVLLAALLSFSLNMKAHATDMPEPINLFEELQQVQAAAFNEEAANNASLSEVEEVASPEARYMIELLIFAYENTGEENSEVWRNPARPSFAEYYTPAAEGNSDTRADLSAQPAVRTFFDTENDGVSQFKGMMKRMEVNGHYRFLKHLIWQQAMLPEEAQDYIYIRGGNSYPLEDDVTLMSMSSVSATKTDLEPLGQNELEGIIRIHLSRYLHIKTDLWFTQFVQNDAGECKIDESPEDAEKPLPPKLGYTPLIHFDLKQNRRMRSNELHYLDHPRFGMLIRITPVEVQ